MARPTKKFEVVYFLTNDTKSLGGYGFYNRFTNQHSVADLRALIEQESKAGVFIDKVGGDTVYVPARSIAAIVYRKVEYED